MKFFLAFMVSFFVFSPSAFCAPPLVSNTFQIEHFKHGQPSKSGLEWRVYFQRNGKAIYSIKRSESENILFIRTEGWRITENGELCTTRKDRNDYDREFTKCTTLVDTGPNTYRRYNENGRLISILTYVGTGKRL